MSRLRTFYPLFLFAAMFVAFSLWSVDGELGDQAFENLAMVEFFNALRESDLGIGPPSFLMQYTDAFRSMLWSEEDLVGLPSTGPIISYLWGNSLAKVLSLNILDFLQGYFGTTGGQMLAVSLIQLGCLVLIAYYTAAKYFTRCVAILAVCVLCSDLFLVQLLHSQLEPQLIYGAIIFLAGLYIFFNITECYTEKKILWTYLSVGIWACFCQINGYPTTQLIIPLYISILYIGWAVRSLSVGTYPFRRILINTCYLLSAFIIGSLLGVFLISLWFESIRFDWLSGVSFVFSNLKTIYGSIIEGSQGISRSAGWDTPYKIFNLLVNNSRVFTGPHQPGMLLGQTYLNLVKVLLLVVGVIALLLNWKQPIAFSFLGLFIALIVRLSFDELHMIWKTNFDAFYGFNIYILIGSLTLIKKTESFKIKNFLEVSNQWQAFLQSTYQSFRCLLRGYLLTPRQAYLSTPSAELNSERNGRGLNKAALSLLLGAIICGTSSLQFHKNFLGIHNRNLGEWNGIGFIRDYVMSRANDNSKILVVLDYDHGDELVPQRLFLKPNKNFFVVSLKHLLNQDPDDIDKQFTKKGISEVLLVTDGSVRTVAHYVDHQMFQLVRRGPSQGIRVKSSQSIPVLSSSGVASHFIEKFDPEVFVSSLLKGVPNVSDGFWSTQHSTGNQDFLPLSDCTWNEDPRRGFGIGGIIDSSGSGIMLVKMRLNQILQATQSHVRVENGLGGYDAEATRLNSSLPQYMLKQRIDSEPMVFQVSIPLIFESISYGELVVPTWFSNEPGDLVKSGIYLKQLPFDMDGRLISERANHGDYSGIRGSVDIHPRGGWFENALNFSFDIKKIEDRFEYIEIKTIVAGEGDTRILSSDQSFHLALIGRVKSQVFESCMQ